MQKLVFYLLLPFLYLIALLPFRLIYILSDFLRFFVVKVFKYRRKVVYKNLRNSFPEKNEAEIEKIAKKFYKFFCDNILETLKMLTMSKNTMKKRIFFPDMSIFDELHKENQSFILMLGHYGSWEWGSAAFELHTPFHILVIYKPLRNKPFDNFVKKLRTGFGQEASSMKNTLRNMIRLKNDLTATAFIADQRPDPNQAYWTTFLHQDAGFIQGTEKIAQKLNYPVVYTYVDRPKRGYYKIYLELLKKGTENTHQGEITEEFVQKLEQTIRKRPELWLWSHDRWKHKKPR